MCYKPRAGEDMATATVVAPMLETIVSIEGTSTSDQTTNIWFQGLTFAHSTYMRPSVSGYLDGQAGQHNLTADANNNQPVGRPAAGVSVTNANHIHFERNLFTQMAATGLDFGLIGEMRAGQNEISSHMTADARLRVCVNVVPESRRVERNGCSLRCGGRDARSCGEDAASSPYSPSRFLREPVQGSRWAHIADAARAL